MTICLTPDCGRPVRTRGLCERCYNILRQYVATGAFTWQHFIRSGKCLPANPTGGNRATHVAQKCLTPHCHQTAINRGLCQRCYTALRGQFAQAEREGRCLPSHRRTRLGTTDWLTAKAVQSPVADNCLNPKCGNPPCRRGLCRWCYSAAQKLVAGEVTSWARLVQMGKALPLPQERVQTWLLDPSPGNDSGCLHCGRPRHIRGLCSSCYGIISRMVFAQVTTWPALIVAGKALRTPHEERIAHLRPTAFWSA